MAATKWNRARTIAALYRSGETMQMIAVRYGISKQRVSIILRDQTGIEPRNRGRPRTAQLEAENVNP